MRRRLRGRGRGQQVLVPGGIDLNIPYVPPYTESDLSLEHPRSENLPLDNVIVGSTQLEVQATDQSHGHQSYSNSGAIMIDEDIAIISAEEFSHVQ